MKHQWQNKQRREKGVLGKEDKKTELELFLEKSKNGFSSKSFWAKPSVGWNKKMKSTKTIYFLPSGVVACKN